MDKIITDKDIINAATSVFEEEKVSEVKYETPFGEMIIVFKEAWYQPDIFK